MIIATDKLKTKSHKTKYNDMTFTNYQYIIFPHSMYDADGNGHIDIMEMTGIVRSIYAMMGPEQVWPNSAAN